MQVNSQIYQEDTLLLDNDYDQTSYDFSTETMFNNTIKLSLDSSNFDFNNSIILED